MFHATIGNAAGFDPGCRKSTGPGAEGRNPEPRPEQNCHQDRLPVFHLNRNDSNRKPGSYQTILVQVCAILAAESTREAGRRIAIAAFRRAGPGITAPPLRANAVQVASLRLLPNKHSDGGAELDQRRQGHDQAHEKWAGPVAHDPPVAGNASNLILMAKAWWACFHGRSLAAMPRTAFLIACLSCLSGDGTG